MYDAIYAAEIALLCNINKLPLQLKKKAEYVPPRLPF
jgi:hypothetical protein